MISYRTAYLKAHYPSEFMAALMSCDSGDTDKIVIEMMECEEMGMQVLPPSVNESFGNFTVVDDKTIRFGLSAIKGLGLGSIDGLLEERKKGPYTSLEEFLKRVPSQALNKKSIEAMACSGALDELGERRAIVESFEDMVKFAKMSQDEASQGQISIFVSMSAEDQGNPVFKLKTVKPATLIERLNFEKQYLGLYVSGHPLRGLTKYLAKKVNLISSLTKRNVGKPVKLGGILASSKKVFTKAGAYMMYGELEDPTGRIEMVVFPKVYNQYQECFKEGLILVMDGRLDLRGNGLQFSVNSAKTVSLDSMITNAKEAGLYNEKEKISRKHIVIEVDKKVQTDPMDESDQLYVAPEPDAEAWKDNAYQIDIKAGTNLEALNALKNLLLSAQGERKVELNIYDISGNFKKIKLPFGINLSNDLEAQIKSLI